MYYTIIVTIIYIAFCKNIIYEFSDFPTAFNLLFVKTQALTSSKLIFFMYSHYYI